MNWLDFFASIVGSIASLAWPAAVFGGICLFRAEIRNALPKLRLKHGETEITFRLDQAEQEVRQLPPAPNQPAPTPEEADRFTQLAAISPRAAILEARTEIDQTLADLASSVGIADARKRGMLFIIRALRERGTIDSTTSAVLNDLRAIGNSAAHDANAELTKDEAVRYAGLANAALATLNRAFMLS